MYINKCKDWDHIDWRNFFLQFPWIESKDHKQIIKKILRSDTKEGIEKDFLYLERMGIINGIGPSYVGKVIIWLISNTFRGVRFEWHDIMYAVGGSLWDRLYADWGLLKYSLVSIGKIYKQIYFFDINPISKLLIFVIFSIIGAPIQCIIAIFCFLMVVVFGGLGSFNYHKKGLGKIFPKL